MSILSTVENAITSHIPNLGNLKGTATSNVDKFKTPVAASQDRSIGNFMYPSNLTVDPDEQHWVTFYINVRGKSKIAQDKSKLVTPGQSVPLNGENRIDPALMAQGNDVAGAVAGAKKAVGALDKYNIGRKVGAISQARSGGSKSGLGASALTYGLAAVGGAVGGAVATDFLVKPDVTYRLKDCISLHVSQSPSAHYSADYDIVNMGSLQGFFDGSSSAVDGAESMKMGLDQFKEFARAAAFNAASKDDSLSARMGAVAKQSLNPYREVLFKQVGYRRFGFDYRFLPKSQAETDQVQKIIQTFKYHMHPELSNQGLFYIHPSEFNIQYYYKGKENNYFNKISTCALVDMHVQYGPQEQFSSFADGAPTEISLHLVFQELETLTKERILKGY
jgi:hypothetical protein